MSFSDLFNSFIIAANREDVLTNLTRANVGLAAMHMSVGNTGFAALHGIGAAFGVARLAHKKLVEDVAPAQNATTTTPAP